MQEDRANEARRFKQNQILHWKMQRRGLLSVKEGEEKKLAGFASQLAPLRAQLQELHQQHLDPLNQEVNRLEVELKHIVTDKDSEVEKYNRLIQIKQLQPEFVRAFADYVARGERLNQWQDELDQVSKLLDKKTEEKKQHGNIMVAVQEQKHLGRKWEKLWNEEKSLQAQKEQLEQQVKTARQVSENYFRFMSQFSNDEIAEGTSKTLYELLKTQQVLQSQREQMIAEKQQVLITQLNQARNDRQSWIDQSQPIEADIAVIEKPQSEAKNNFDALEEQLAEMVEESQQFLLQLTSNPDALFNQFAEVFEKALKQYDVDHPFNQSAEVRSCIADAYEQIAQIRYAQVEPEESTPGEYKEVDLGNVSQITAQERKVYQLYGCLWNLLDRIQFPLKNRSFGHALLSILDAPFFHDARLDESECLKEFNDLTLIKPDLNKNQHAQELEQLEEANFQKARADLSEAINRKHRQDPLRKKAENVLNEVVAHKTSTAKKDFDTKYHTMVLASTQGLLENPHNEPLQRKYKSLIEHEKNGKASTCKKLLGALVMFFSVVLVAVSGISMNGAGIVIGTLGFAAGMKLFHCGMERGVRKKAMQFEEEAEQAYRNAI